MARARPRGVAPRGAAALSRACFWYFGGPLSGDSRARRLFRSRAWPLLPVRVPVLVAVAKCPDDILLVPVIAQDPELVVPHPVRVRLPVQDREVGPADDVGRLRIVDGLSALPPLGTPHEGLADVVLVPSVLDDVPAVRLEAARVGLPVEDV